MFYFKNYSILFVLSIYCTLLMHVYDHMKIAQSWCRSYHVLLLFFSTFQASLWKYSLTLNWSVAQQRLGAAALPYSCEMYLI